MYKIIVFIILLLPAELYTQVIQEWVARYDGPNTNTDRGNAITVDAAGNVFVTGDSRGNGSNSDYLTIKYNNSGVQQWTARYNGTGNNIDIAQAITTDAFGNVYVTGYSRGTSDITSDYATIKYNASGVQQWVARYNGPWNYVDIAYSIAVDATGNVYVTGYSYGNAPSSDYLTIKYNSSGVQLWEARYDAAGGSDQASSLAIDEFGNVYVTGYSYSNILGNSDYATVKYNSSGILQWVARYNGPADNGDQARQLVLDEVGNIYVIGFSASPDSLFDYATVKYNSFGVQQWTARYNGPDNLSDLATSIAVDKNGNVYVTGSSATETSPVTKYDCATIKYSSSGVQQWVTRYDGPASGTDVAISLKVDALGNVFFTGYSEGIGSSSDYLTVKYNTSGFQQWVTRYNGPVNGQDGGSAIAIDGAGNVYVTGTSRNADYDYVTIKYQDTPLPVKMAYFNSIVLDNNAVLSWGTVSEINNAGFRIERKSTVENKWVEAGFINGNGTTSEEKHYKFEDKKLAAGVYKYRLKQIDYNGNYEYHYLQNDETIGTPKVFEVSQNYPNPSNPKTKIDFQIPIDGNISLRVYDISGKEIAVLVDGFKTADFYSVEFDGSDLGSGIYFYRIIAKGLDGFFSKTMKMVLVK